MRQPMDRHMLLRANWVLILLTLILVGLGIFNLYSASSVRSDTGVFVGSYYSKQAMWVGVGVLVMLVTMLIDYHLLYSFNWAIWGMAIVLLLMVFVFGSHAKGAQRWIEFGSMKFQPSEAAKVAVLIAAARVLSLGKDPLGWKELARVLLVGLIPAGMIFLQPDLGTSLIVVFMLGGMILFRGVIPSILKVGIILMLVSPLLVWKVVLPNLKEYQQDRILSFVNPEKADKKTIYQSNQAKIAIGSGQVWGKGFGNGTQNNLRFLPERHTDYAIAVWGEEWGFVGSVTLVAIFSCFLLAIYSTARDAKDRFGSMLTAGVFFYFFWQILINIAMVLGMLPVVGVPLPFISYGGTATLVNFCLVGIVISVSMRRFTFNPRSSFRFDGTPGSFRSANLK